MEYALAIILPLVVVLIISAAAADTFHKIACMKGHEERKYFWWTFFFLPIGALMVISLPDRKPIDRKCPSAGTPAREYKSAPPKTFAAEQPTPPVIEAPLTEQSAAPEVTPISTDVPDQIQCPVCGKVQKANRKVCWDCGVHFKRD